MKVGPAIRSLMPFWLERKAAQLYRRVFVDMEKVADMLAAEVPPSAIVLDIGGGDGELLNLLLTKRPDLHITMVDIAPNVGRFLEDQHRSKVAFCPGTSIEAHLEKATAHYDVAIVSDVIHHIPKTLRKAFLRDVRNALKTQGLLFIKDIEPGHPIAALSLFADRHISGDKGVSLVSMEYMSELASSALPAHQYSELGLLQKDSPNYILRFSFGP